MILLVAGLLASLFWFTMNRSTEPDELLVLAASEQTGSAGSSAAVDQRSAPGAGPSATAPAPASRRARPAPARELRIEPGDPLAPDASPEELNWLNQHRFPSEEILQEAPAWAWSVMDGATGAQYFHDLRRITALDISKAQSFALIHPEYSPAAIDYLMRAAADGSIYALHALSGIFGFDRRGQDPARNWDPFAAVAFHRAAELRGDWSAVLARGLLPTGALSEEARMLADWHAYNILRELDELRAAQALPPLQQSLRPGLPSRSELEQGLEEIAQHRAAEEDDSP